MRDGVSVYKYEVKREGVIIGRGITCDLIRRTASVKERFPGAVIKQVGKKTTWAEAQAWEAREAERK